jgi:hypothetical protein
MRSNLARSVCTVHAPNPSPGCEVCAYLGRMAGLKPVQLFRPAGDLAELDEVDAELEAEDLEADGAEVSAAVLEARERLALAQFDGHELTIRLARRELELITLLADDVW